MKKIKITELLIYIFCGFYIGFFISALADITDICGSPEAINFWGPKGFLVVATVILIFYYFVSKFVKKDLHFIIIVVIIAVLFEGLVAQPYIKRDNMDFIELWAAMPIVHFLIFYPPRVLIRKLRYKV